MREGGREREREGNRYALHALLFSVFRFLGFLRGEEVKR